MRWFATEATGGQELFAQPLGCGTADSPAGAFVLGVVFR